MKLERHFSLMLPFALLTPLPSIVSGKVLMALESTHSNLDHLRTLELSGHTKAGRRPSTCPGTRRAVSAVVSAPGCPKSTLHFKQELIYIWL